MSPQPNFFPESIITFLLPYFSIHAADLRGARSEILDTLTSYATRTRAEMLQAAQIVALGMTMLDVLVGPKPRRCPSPCESAAGAAPTV